MGGPRGERAGPVGGRRVTSWPLPWGAGKPRWASPRIELATGNVCTHDEGPSEAGESVGERVRPRAADGGSPHGRHHHHAGTATGLQSFWQGSALGMPDSGWGGRRTGGREPVGGCGRSRPRGTRRERGRRRGSPVGGCQGRPLVPRGGRCESDGELCESDGELCGWAGALRMTPDPWCAPREPTRGTRRRMTSAAGTTRQLAEVGQLAVHLRPLGHAPGRRGPRRRAPGGSPSSGC